MNKNFNNIIKNAKAVKLSVSTKDEIRKKIMASMEYTPFADAGTVEFSGAYFFSASFFRTRVVPAALAVTLLVGGGVSYAAEDTLPGDVLYSIKVNINEEVHGLLAFSEKTAVEWESERAGRRLDEAEKLAVAGRLDADTQQKLAVQFEAHAQKVSEKIKKFEDKNDLTSATLASANLETSLRAHEKVLVALSGKTADALSGKTSAAASMKIASDISTSTDSTSSGSNEPLSTSTGASSSMAMTASVTEVNSEESAGALLLKVQQAADDAARTRVKIEEKLASQSIGSSADARVAAEARFRVAAESITTAKSLINDSKSAMTVRGEILVQAEALVRSAEDQFTRGKIKLDARDYRSAFSYFQIAILHSQEASTLIKVHKEKTYLDVIQQDPGNMTQSDMQTDPSFKLLPPKTATTSNTINISGQTQIKLYPF